MTGSSPITADADSLPDRLARQILTASSIAIVVVDVSGTITFANDRAATSLGVSRTELVGIPYDDPGWQFSDANGELIPIAEHPVTRVLETGEPIDDVEHWLTCPDGDQRWLKSNYTPIVDDGAVSCVAVSFEDVTELKHRAERLTSEHRRHVEIRADNSAVPPSLRVDDAPIRLEVESIVSLPDTATVQYMQTADLSPAQFITAIEEVPHLEDVRLLSTTGDTTRIEVSAEAATASEVFQSLGGQPQAIVITEDGVSFHGELPGNVDPRRATDGIRAFHDDVSLVAESLVYSPQLLAEAVADALTDRQLAVLQAAYFSGYYESPRSSTGTELAARFEISRQTFNQHLRRAHQIVSRHLFEPSSSSVTD